MTDNCGVVCVINNVAKCVTCRYGGRSCVHVEEVRALVNSEEPPSQLPHKFVDVLTMDFPKVKSKVQPTFQSGRQIPVNFTEDQKTIMKLSNNIRLGIEDGVSHLIPDMSAMPTCSHCTAIWSLPVVVRECTVITEKQLLEAKG